MAEEGFGWAQGMMDFYERENKKAPMGMFGETLRSIAEAITTIPISMIESSLTNKAPALEGVGSYEDMQKWMGNPENAKVYEEWVSGIIPETGAMLKSVGLKQFAKSAAVAGSKLAGPEREGFLSRAQAVYGLLDKQVTQREFDWFESFTHGSLPTKRTGVFGHNKKDIAIDLEQLVDPQAARKTAIHEIVHSGQFAQEDPITKAMVDFRTKGIDALVDMVEQSSEQTLQKKEFRDTLANLNQVRYLEHDPTEAMSRMVSEELHKDTITPLRKVFDNYVEKFGKEYPSYAAKPAETGEEALLGPNFRKLFNEIYLDNLLGSLE